MKVVQVTYQGKQRNVFLYDGMSSEEVASLLSACVTSTLDRNRSGPAPRLLALRDPVSGTVVPLSLALKHLPSLWNQFELLDENYTGANQGATKNVNSTFSNYAPSASPAGSYRPSSSPANDFATNPRTVAGLPTPITRVGANTIGAASYRPSSAYASSSVSSSLNSSPDRPLRVNNYTGASAASSAAVNANKYNFTGAGYDSSPQQSANSSPAYTPYDSPRFNAVASPTSSIASEGSWNDEELMGNSGIHVVLSYRELLEILSGFLPPNINNGPNPPATLEAHYMFALAIVEPGSAECEEMFLHYQRFASSKAFNHLVFLIIESTLLKGSALETERPALPVFQFFLKGHLLGQLNRPTVAQLKNILHSSNRLVSENPNLRVDSDDQEYEDEDEYEESDVADSADEESDWRRAALKAASPAASPPRVRRQGSFSLGEAIDQRYQLSEQERREVFADAAEEEARWAQLLQPSPKLGPSRPNRGQTRARAASESPDLSPSPSDSDGEGWTAPPSAGLVIRGQKIPIRAVPASQHQQRGQLRDSLTYEQFDGSDSVDESDYGSASDGGSYEQSADESEDGAPVADGGSEYSQALSVTGSQLSSLVASPTLSPRTANASAAQTGIVMSSAEASTIERLILRQDADVKAAFRACPDLDRLMEVFVRLVHFQLANPLPQPNPHANAQLPPAASSSVNSSPTKVALGKRKEHPVQHLIAEEPKYKRLLPESKRLAEKAAAAARARHKRLNQSVYYSDEDNADEDDEDEEEYSQPQPSDSEAAFSDEEKVFPMLMAPSDASAARDAEQKALAHLHQQQAKYVALQEQYAAIQNEIFSKTVHDLRSQNFLSQQQLEYLVHLWTQTESGSNAIRALIKSYEVKGDELEFMQQLIGLADRFAAGDSIESESPQATGSEDDDEYDGESPLPSDEEEQYQALLRKFAEGSSVSASPTGSEGSSLQASPVRVAPRSSTKAPRPSPAAGAPPTNKAEAVAAEAANSSIQQDEEALRANLLLVAKLAEADLLSPDDARKAQQYLIHGHPVLQAAFLAFSYNEDLEDCLDTIHAVLEGDEDEEDEDEEDEAPVQKDPRASGPNVKLAHPDQLLAVMPPWIVSSHESQLRSLVESNDLVTEAAWDNLQAGVGVRNSKELASDVEDFIDTVVRRMKVLENQPQAPAPGNDAKAVAEIRDALQVTAVLHTGGVFDDQETAVLWTLILQGNPVISAAFQIAREEESYEELHDTLIRLIQKNVHLKSASHPLLPLVRQQTSTTSVSQMQQLIKNIAASNDDDAPAPKQTTGVSSTPARTSAPLPPPATPISPSIPTTAWSRVVATFTRTIERLQARNQLSDAQALWLIDEFQSKSPALVAACEVLELDQNEDEFTDTIRLIVAEKEETDLRSPKKQHSENPFSTGASTQTDSAPAASAAAPTSSQASASSAANAKRDRLVQSFAERVQAVESGDYDEEAEDEEEEDEDEDEDGGDSEDSLDRLLAKDENEEWDDESIDQLYNKVMTMQAELTRLKKEQAEKGMPVDDDDDDDQDWIQEEDEEEEEEGSDA